MPNVCRFESQRHQLTRNLLRVLDTATAEDISRGLAWYPSAVSGVDAWSAAFDVPRETVACVISAISPQCDWQSNLRIALALLQGTPYLALPGGALNVNKHKAARVLADRATDLADYFPHGPKVQNFARNLQDIPDAVTVDTHAVQAAVADVEATVSLKPVSYAIFADCYRDAARKAQMRPCDFQAVVWCAWKRRYPRERKIQLRRQWHVAGEAD